MGKTHASLEGIPHVGADQQPLFEVEIHTGNRARSGHPGAGSRTKAPAEVGSPLALRRARAARRRLLVRICLLTLALALIIWSTAKEWQPLLVVDVVARVNNRTITYQQVGQMDTATLGQRLQAAK